MTSIFRKYQRSLMLVIAILTIVAFAFLYNPANTSELDANTAARIYDRNLTKADIEREVKNFSLTRSMQQYELLRDLGGMAEDENQAVSEFVWNLLVLQHEARALGVVPTDAQVEERFKALPDFQTNGQFDPTKLQAFVDKQLSPRGFTFRQMESIIRDSLTLERLRQIIGAPVTVSESEIREAARLLQKVDLQVVRFPADEILPSIQVTNEEIQSYYGRTKQQLPETRVVEYVEFPLPADKLASEGKEKIEAKQKVANAASVFAQQAAGKNFAEAAAVAGLTVKTTPEFDQQGSMLNPTDEVAVTRVLAPSAFVLGQDALSDVIEGEDKFYIFKVARVSPSRQMTFEEARPFLENQIKTMKASSAVQQIADAQIAALNAALVSGKTLTEGAAEAGIKLENFDGLDPEAVQTLTSEQRMFLQPSLIMEQGQLSGMMASPIGNFAVYVSKRTPLDEAVYAKKRTELQQQILEGKRAQLFATWLNSARDAAKISMGQNRATQ